MPSPPACCAATPGTGGAEPGARGGPSGAGLGAGEAGAASAEGLSAAAAAAAACCCCACCRRYESARPASKAPPPLYSSGSLGSAAAPPPPAVGGLPCRGSAAPPAATGTRGRPLACPRGAAPPLAGRSGRERLRLPLMAAGQPWAAAATASGRGEASRHAGQHTCSFMFLGAIAAGQAVIAGTCNHPSPPNTGLAQPQAPCRAQPAKLGHLCSPPHPHPASGPPARHPQAPPDTRVLKTDVAAVSMRSPCSSSAPLYHSRKKLGGRCGCVRGRRT
jgi:hypothetical protein